MINRTIILCLKKLAQYFPVVALMGPPQSGKTTVAKATFPNYKYISLEDLDIRSNAKNDPRGFLKAYSVYEGVIIDEIQKVPELFSYMQGIVDETYRPGYFIITGSQNFLRHEKITQTLAGRIALLTLLPLSIKELQDAGLLEQNINAQLIKGFYPRLYSQNIDVQTWCANYIATYVEKDVRQLLQISDVITFQRFLKLCAARVGNLLNYASIAQDAGISPNTAKAWISILETSYIIKLVAPYHRNFSKRIIKSPKIYFYDSALVCSLLGIKTSEELSFHPLRGALFESFVQSEMFKFSYNTNITPQIYFWRDVQGHEIDALIEKSFEKVVPIEIKAGMTINDDFFKELHYFQTISEQEEQPGYIVYGGDHRMTRKNIHIFPWNSLPTMLEEIYKD